LFRGPSGIKDYGIFGPVNGFPEIIDRYIFVGQMAIDTANGSMCPDMKPGLELRLHHMAGGTKNGSFCPGDKLRGTKGQENSKGSGRDC